MTIRELLFSFITIGLIVFMLDGIIDKMTESQKTEENKGVCSCCKRQSEFKENDK